MSYRKSDLISECNRDDLIVPDDLFAISDGDHYILYAPLSKGVLMVNGSALTALQNYKNGMKEMLLANTSFYEELVMAGILVDRRKLHHVSSRFQSGKTGFDPDGVSLLLTDKCSMRCVYCYSNGGELTRTMKWKTAKAALDWIINHVRHQGRNRFFVSFHGGGEVTTALPVMKRCVKYVRDLAQSNGLEVRIEAGLNGVMTKPVMEWVSNNLDGATLSLDGLPTIQDRQRPLANGKDSFDIVDASLKYFDDKGFKYGIRATVMGEGLKQLVDSITFMARNYSAKVIQVEPMFPIGRAQTQNLMPVDPLLFVKHFRAAREVAQRYHKELKYSGARFATLTNIFCKAVASSFAITPDGEVTSCYEITDPSDKRTELFYYGSLDSDTGQFTFDEDKLGTLQSLTVENKTFCRNCFCKYHCAGDCPAKLAALGDAWDPSSNPRCHVNRELTKDQIKEWLTLL